MVVIEHQQETEEKKEHAAIPHHATDAGKDDSDGFETASDTELSGDDDGAGGGEVHGEHSCQQDHGQEKDRSSSYDASNSEELEQKAVAQANEAKLEGKKLFGDGKYEEALLQYEIALQVAPDTPSSVEIRSICHANRGVCFLKLGQYENTVKECSKAVELNPLYIIALVRRGEAHEKLERFEEAISDMKKILEIDPSNDQARKAACRLEPFAAEKREKMKEEMIGVADKGLFKVTTLPADISHGKKLESSSSKFKLERSKTERQRHLRPEDAAQIFDDKVPVQEKLKLLNRIATVKDDATVEFEVPVDVEPEALDARSKHVQNVVDDSHDATDLHCIPPLNIVMLIVGTRGDVQPFVAIGKRLQDYGHRVRLATHSNFKEFVLTAGLEFYPLGGDPKVLAGYMVKNKGFLPSGLSEIPVQRNQMKEIINSLLPACRDPDFESGVPFKADAIIANPPAYGHTHVAEALKIPIHIFCTIPWTPTSEVPHPWSRVKQQAGYRLSYQIVDSLIWLGIRDMINDLRKKKLKLRPVAYLSGSPGSDTDVPHAYIWSPHLVPKPKDWGPKIDVVGFCFLDLASNYEPPEGLVKWLEEGDKPIYIGFGSLPVQEPKKMTQIIVEALEKTGQRGIINKGWESLGTLAEPKKSIYLLDNIPHDWLFLRCKAVVHHGGAGTTAAGLKAACPTTIVPVFGDQPFWGDRVHARGVGPPPIPVDEFSLSKLVDAINFMLDPKVKERAVELAKAMENEDGVTGAVKAFFKQLPRKKPEPDPEPLLSSIFSTSKCFCCS